MLQKEVQRKSWKKVHENSSTKSQTKSYEKCPRKTCTKIKMPKKAHEKVQNIWNISKDTQKNVYKLCKKFKLQKKVHKKVHVKKYCKNCQRATCTKIK